MPEPYGDTLAGEVDGLALWRAGFDRRRPPSARRLLAPAGLLASATLTYETEVPVGGATLRVTGHDGGDVDWFTADADAPLADPELTTRQVVPQRLHYPGAPAPRWWQIEDAAVDIGGFPPDRSHLATALLIELSATTRTTGSPCRCHRRRRRPPEELRRRAPASSSPSVRRA